MGNICQAAITILGCLAIWLIGAEGRCKRWGFLLGLLSQPFWLYTSYINRQWGIFALSGWYTIAWARGFLNYK